jgi:hypothetical protein
VRRQPEFIPWYAWPFIPIIAVALIGLALLVTVVAYWQSWRDEWVPNANLQESKNSPSAGLCDTERV